MSGLTSLGLDALHFHRFADARAQSALEKLTDLRELRLGWLRDDGAHATTTRRALCGLFRSAKALRTLVLIDIAVVGQTGPQYHVATQALRESGHWGVRDLVLDNVQGVTWSALLTWVQRPAAATLSVAGDVRFGLGGVPVASCFSRIRAHVQVYQGLSRVPTKN